MVEERWAQRTVYGGLALGCDLASNEKFGAEEDFREVGVDLPSGVVCDSDMADMKSELSIRC